MMYPQRPARRHRVSRVSVLLLRRHLQLDSVVALAHLLPLVVSLEHLVIKIHLEVRLIFCLPEMCSCMT